MANKNTICTTNQVEYSDIRKAMCQGARTMEDVIESAGICGECDGCKENMGYILSTLCGCKEVSMETVITAVREGAHTVEKVMEQTGAGTGDGCGRCQALISNVIQLGH